MTGITLAPQLKRNARTLEASAVKGRSLWDDARRRLFRNRAAVASMILLGLFLLAAIVGPYLIPDQYDTINKSDVWDPPLSAGHLLGTDSLGRDLLARLLVGLRVSLAIGVVAIAEGIHAANPVGL